MLKVTRVTTITGLIPILLKKDLQTEVDTKLVKIKKMPVGEALKAIDKSIVMSLRKIRRIMVEQRLEVQTQKKFKHNVSHIRIPESSLISWIELHCQLPNQLGLQI